MELKEVKGGCLLQDNTALLEHIYSILKIGLKAQV